MRPWWRSDERLIGSLSPTTLTELNSQQWSQSCHSLGSWVIISSCSSSYCSVAVLTKVESTIIRYVIVLVISQSNTHPSKSSLSCSKHICICLSAYWLSTGYNCFYSFNRRQYPLSYIILCAALFLRISEFFWRTQSISLLSFFLLSRLFFIVHCIQFSLFTTFWIFPFHFGLFELHLPVAHSRARPFPILVDPPASQINLFSCVWSHRATLKTRSTVSVLYVGLTVHWAISTMR